MADLGQMIANRIAEYTRKAEAQLGSASEVRVGFLEGATYPDGTPVAMVAAIQEYGAPGAGTPPRPFFRNMIEAKKTEWAPALRDALRDTDNDARVALGRLGAGIQGQIQQSITDTVDPPLSPITLMLRKMRHENPDLVVTGKTVAEAAARVAKNESTSGESTKPLIYTGHLRNSVDYEVK